MRSLKITDTAPIPLPRAARVYSRAFIWCAAVVMGCTYGALLAVPLHLASGTSWLPVALGLSVVLSVLAQRTLVHAQRGAATQFQLSTQELSRLDVLDGVGRTATPHEQKHRR